MRVLLAISTAAIMLAAPTLAQQKSSDADTKQKVTVLIEKFHDAYVKGDAPALSKLFTEDGVYIAPSGRKFHGTKEVEEAYNLAFKAMGGIKSFESIADEIHPLSDGSVWVIGHASIEGATASAKSHWAAIDVPAGNELKARMLTIGTDVLPPQPQTAQTPPTK